MRFSLWAVAIVLSCSAATAQEITKCRLEFTCANIHPCQTAKNAEGVEFEFEVLSDNHLRVNLGDRSLPLLKLTQTSEDLTTAHGWDEARSASYTFSIFADGTIAYATHLLVGQGISLTGLGRCDLND